MTDPFSIASGVVGIISLGITVCNGLFEYLGAVKGGKQEVADNLHQARRLLSILQYLDEVQDQIDDTLDSDFSTLRESLSNSQRKLQDLDRFLVELRSPSNAPGTREHMKQMGRSLIYPYHQRKINALKDLLRGLLVELAVAIETVILYDDSLTMLEFIANYILQSVQYFTVERYPHRQIYCKRYSGFATQAAFHAVRVGWQDPGFWGNA